MSKVKSDIMYTVARYIAKDEGIVMTICKEYQDKEWIQ